MTQTTDPRPWLLLDLDGVFALDVTNSQSRRRHLTRLAHTSHQNGRRYTLHLDTAAAAKVRALAPVLRLAWCTTWQEEANHRIGRFLGMPVLPVVTFDDVLLTERARRERGLGKSQGILEFVGDDPFLWLDDTPITDERAALAEHMACTGSAIIQVDPKAGVTDEVLAQIEAWRVGLGFARR